MNTEHLPTRMAALGLSPCLGRRNAQAWAEVATMQGDTLSRREAAYPRAVTNRPDGPLTAVMAANPQDGDDHENE